MTYKIQNTKIGTNGIITANLMEDDCVIAKVKTSKRKFRFGQFDYKFYSGRAQCRFETFCNALSIEETIQAIWEWDCRNFIKAK